MDKGLGLLFLVMSALTALYMGVQAHRGTVPLFSVRNVFLTGLIVFQLSSASIAYFTAIFGEMSISEPVLSGVKYAGILTVFMFIFTVVYELNWFTFRLDSRFSSRMPSPGVATMVALSIGFLLVAFFFRLVLVYIPVFGVLAIIIGVGLAATAAGFAAWAWARQPLNPATIIPFIMVAAGASGLALYQSFGRRDMLSVLVACLWGAYQGKFKDVSFRRAALPMAIILTVCVVLVSAYSSVRAHSPEGMPFTETLRRLAQANVTEGFLSLLGGQDAAANSIWLLESRPDSIPYDTLHSARYMILAGVPRVIYADKPAALGQAMVPQTGTTGKSMEFSFGPGLVGHIANDNPWLALPVYAVFLAAFVRVLDNFIRRNPTNPFVVVPIGVALGEILAIPRGELGLFVFRSIVAIVMSYVSAAIVARTLVALGMRYEGTTGAEPAYDEDVDDEVREAWPEEYR